MYPSTPGPLYLPPTQVVQASSYDRTLAHFALKKIDNGFLLEFMGRTIYCESAEAISKQVLVELVAMKLEA
jgi:hypothetical protein